MNNVVRSGILVLCSAFYANSWAMSQENLTPHESIQSRYERIQRAHMDVMQSLQASKSPSSKVAKEYARRNAELQGLVDAARQTDTKDLSVEDLLALVAGSEQLRSFEGALTFARLAFKVDPANDQAFFGLVRNLLNCAKYDEAEQLTESVASAISIEHDRHSIYGPLFMARRNLGDFEQAVPHIDHFILHFLASISRTDDLPHGLEVYLGLLKETRAATDRGESFESRLHRFDDVLKDAESALESANHEANMLAQFRRSAVMEARFELAVFLDHELASERFLKWIELLVGLSQRFPDADKELTRELQIAHDILGKHAFLDKCSDEINRRIEISPVASVLPVGSSEPRHVHKLLVDIKARTANSD
jgi:tetratricopeptide (TPR) repeat protein